LILLAFEKGSQHVAFFLNLILDRLEFSKSVFRECICLAVHESATQ